jgi:hypothetical protein
MRGMTYKSASRRAQRALLAIGAGLTLAVAAAPVAQATPAKASDGTCVANANGTINSDGTSAGATSTCPGDTVADSADKSGGKGNGKGKGDGGGGDTGHKVG